MHARRSAALAAVAIYLASVVVANWLTTHYGFVPVGFGHLATAGTFAAGGALVVRDVVQDAVGRAGVFALILLAAGLSWLVANPAIAVASGCAFLLSETVDMAGYTALRPPLRVRRTFGDWKWSAAVALGGLLGAVADSVIFLWIAFGRSAIAPNIAGQLIGKAEVIAAFIVLGALGRAVLREPVYAEGA
jgi:uncharacterized PurR-regulated membrane protein YhhQ (DUF165 family)